VQNNKTPGFYELTTDMLKNLPTEAILLLTKLFQEYWSNTEIDHKLWHKIKLSNLCKGKGDPQDPNNCMERNLLKRNIGMQHCKHHHC